LIWLSTKEPPTLPELDELLLALLDELAVDEDVLVAVDEALLDELALEEVLALLEDELLLAVDEELLEEELAVEAVEEALLALDALLAVELALEEALLLADELLEEAPGPLSAPPSPVELLIVPPPWPVLLEPIAPVPALCAEDDDAGLDPVPLPPWPPVPTRSDPYTEHAAAPVARAPIERSQDSCILTTSLGYPRPSPLSIRRAAGHPRDTDARADCVRSLRLRSAPPTR